MPNLKRMACFDGTMLRVVLVLVLTISFSPANATDVKVTASVDNPNVVLGESFTLTITVEGPLRGIDPPELPEMPDLSLINTSSSSNFSYNNGIVRNEKIYHFHLIADLAGAVTIPAIPVMVKGKVYLTDSIELVVQAMNGGVAIVAPSDGSTVAPEQAIGFSSEDDIRMTSWEIEDERSLTKTAPSPGLSNRVADAGESIDLAVYLKNFSQKDYISTSAFFSTEDAFVNVESNNIRYDEIYPNETIKSPTPIVMHIAADTPHGHTAEVSIRIQDSAYRQSLRSSFFLPIDNVGPIDFQRAIVDDDVIGGSQGDDDGILEAGETIELIIFIQNKGVVDLTDITMKILPNSNTGQFVNITDDTHLYRDLKANQERATAADYDIQLLESLGALPRVLSFQVDLSARAKSETQAGYNYYYTWSRRFEVNANQPDAKVDQLQPQ